MADVEVVPYDDLPRDHRFVHAPTSLTEYEPDRVRLHVLLRHRGVEALEARVRDAETALTEMTRKVEFVEEQLEIARGRVRELLQSGSWRLTAPLRWIWRGLRRIGGR